MFVDDITLLATHRDKKIAEGQLQHLVDIVSAWSKEWKIILNADKCKVCFFTTDNKEANWSPSIIIDGKVLKHEPTPKLLGVTLDRQLCFSKHVDNVTKAATNKLKVLAKLAYSDWGSDKFQLFRVYQAVVRSRLDYAASAWQAWLSTTQMNRLETVQNKCLRAVTGQTRSTPVEALRLEAGTHSYKTISERLTLISYEKAARFPKGHPRRELFDNEVPPRNKRNSWRRKVKALSNILPPQPMTGPPFQLLPAHLGKKRAIMQSHQLSLALTAKTTCSLNNYAQHRSTACKTIAPQQSSTQTARQQQGQKKEVLQPSSQQETSTSREPRRKSCCAAPLLHHPSKKSCKPCTAQ